MQAHNMCMHVLFCNHAGHVETLKHTIDLLEECLCKGDTDLDLLNCIAEYAYGRGGQTMVNICHGLKDHLQQMVRDQDTIGWQQFMEGMICTCMCRIQSLYHFREGTRLPPEHWAQGLILKLLKATLGQWI
jgi:hypothetical protein